MPLPGLMNLSRYMTLRSNDIYISQLAVDVFWLSRSCLGFGSFYVNPVVRNNAAFTSCQNLYVSWKIIKLFFENMHADSSFCISYVAEV